MIHSRLARAGAQGVQDLLPRTWLELDGQQRHGPVSHQVLSDSLIMIKKKTQNAYGKRRKFIYKYNDEFIKKFIDEAQMIYF